MNGADVNLPPDARAYGERDRYARQPVIREAQRTYLVAAATMHAVIDTYGTPCTAATFLESVARGGEPLLPDAADALKQLHGECGLGATLCLCPCHDTPDPS